MKVQNKIKEVLERDSIIWNLWLKLHQQEEPQSIANVKRENEKHQIFYFVGGKIKSRERIKFNDFFLKEEDKTKIRRSKQRERRQNDPKFKLNNYIRNRIRRSLKSLKGLKKQNILKGKRHWESFVNFTLQEFVIHLESLFQDGMTWKNYGKWHIDHVKPIVLFNFKIAEDPEFKECWALKNLQPLWAKDNDSKGVKFTLKNNQNFILSDNKDNV